MYIVQSLLLLLLSFYIFYIFLYKNHKFHVEDNDSKPIIFRGGAGNAIRRSKGYRLGVNVDLLKIINKPVNNLHVGMLQLQEILGSEMAIDKIEEGLRVLIHNHYIERVPLYNESSIYKDHELFDSPYRITPAGRNYLEVINQMHHMETQYEQEPLDIVSQNDEVSAVEMHDMNVGVESETELVMEYQTDDIAAQKMVSKTTQSGEKRKNIKTQTDVKTYSDACNETSVCELNVNTNLNVEHLKETEIYLPGASQPILAIDYLEEETFQHVHVGGVTPEHSNRDTDIGYTSPIMRGHSRSVSLTPSDANSFVRMFDLDKIDVLEKLAVKISFGASSEDEQESILVDMEHYTPSAPQSQSKDRSSSLGFEIMQEIDESIEDSPNSSVVLLKERKDSEDV